MKQRDIEIPVGYYDFHSDVGLNFQLNLRLYTTGLFSKEEIFSIGKKIKDYQGVTVIMNQYAEKAEA